MAYRDEGGEICVCDLCGATQNGARDQWPTINYAICCLNCEERALAMGNGDEDHDDEDRRAYHEELNRRPRPSEY